MSKPQWWSVSRLEGLICTVAGGEELVIYSFVNLLNLSLYATLLLYLILIFSPSFTPFTSLFSPLASAVCYGLMTVRLWDLRGLKHNKCSSEAAAAADITVISDTPDWLFYLFSFCQARIKAINTYFGKKSFHTVESSVYSQHGQPQAQCGSPVYMQQVYNPQQQYPVYSVVSPSWSPSGNTSVMPYFGTPLVRIWILVILQNVMCL